MVGNARVDNPESLSALSTAMKAHSLWLVTLAGLVACAKPPAPDIAADRAALLALHEQILASHRTDDADAWLAMESDTIAVGNQGEWITTVKQDRANARRRYLAATHFTVYRDLQPPVATVSDDGTLGWVFAQVEMAGTLGAPPDTVAVDDVWTWVELYKKGADGWKMVGNVSTARP